MERDSFENLASTISDDERQSILDRITSSDSQNNSNLSDNTNSDQDDAPLEIKLQHESFFLRFIVWL